MAGSSAVARREAGERDYLYARDSREEFGGVCLCRSALVSGTSSTLDVSSTVVEALEPQGDEKELGGGNQCSGTSSTVVISSTSAGGVEMSVDSKGFCRLAQAVPPSSSGVSKSA
jgi:hypothetical protein